MKPQAPHELARLFVSSDQLARRRADAEVRSQNRHAEEVLDIVSKAAEPLTTRLMDGHKMRRGEVATFARQVHKRLSDHPGIVHTQIDVQGGRTTDLSAKERADIRSIVMASNPEPGHPPVLAFYATETLADRHSLGLYIHQLDIRLARHAYEQYRERERRVQGPFIANLPATLAAVQPLASACIRQGVGHIALPLASGLGLGRVRVWAASPEDETAFGFLVTRQGIRSHARTDRPRDYVARQRKAEVDVLIRTYCDYDSLTGHRERLHGAITDFAKEHRTALWCFFETYHFGSMREAETDEHVTQLKAMVADAERLVGSADWRHFAARQDALEAERQAPQAAG